VGRRELACPYIVHLVQEPVGASRLKGLAVLDNAADELLIHAGRDQKGGPRPIGKLGEKLAKLGLEKLSGYIGDVWQRIGCAHWAIGFFRFHPIIA
jgi:hypothetical protein